MELQDRICEMLKDIGNAKPKKMFGTYNITLDGAHLGIISGEKWYLKRVPPLTELLEERGVVLDTSIKDESYVITDFSDPAAIREYAGVVRDYIKAQPRKRRR